MLTALSRDLASRPAWVRYGGAIVATGAGLLLRLALASWLGTTVPYITFFPAVIASSAFGGFGPGLLCTLLSVLAVDLLVFPPYFNLAMSTPADYFGAALFLLIGTMISWSEQVILRERKRTLLAEAAERNQRRLYQQTLAGIGDAVIATDRTLRVEFMNAVAEALTGWTRQEAQGRPIPEVFRIFDEITGAPRPNPLEEVIRTGVATGLANHTVLHSRNGAITPLDDSAAPIRDESGSVAGAVLVFRDVSGRRAAERALQDSERRSWEILESITDGFLALDGEWRFTYVNAAAERSIGSVREDLIGKVFWDIFPQSRDSISGREYRRAIETQSAAHFEVFSEKLKGWFEVAAYPASSGGLSLYFRDISEHKRARAELVAAKEEIERARDLLHVTLASIGDAVIACDARRRITFVNEVASQLTGVTAGEAAGRPLDEVLQFWSEVGERMENPAAKVLLENQPASVANHGVLKTAGGEIPVDASAAPIRNAAGEVIGAVIVFCDVTERRKARQELERSEERRRLAMEAGQIGVWDWDVARNQIEWSERVYETHGIAPGAFGGGVEEYSKLMHPEDRPAVQESIRRALEGETIYAEEFRIVRPNGEIRWVNTRAQVVRGAGGAPLRMLGASIDVTARRSAEMALRESESRLQLALEVGSMATWDWDIATGSVVWSEAHYRVLGYNPGEVEPSYQLWADSIHPDDRKGVLESVETARQERRVYRLEYRTAPRSDGSIRWLEARGQFFYDRAGNALRMIGIMLDVTDRKHVEESLLRANEELQHFAYAASHDLQEPLRTITSFSQLLVREYPQKDSPAGQYVSFIVDGTTRMRALIEGMLEFSRAGGAATFAVRPTSSKDVVESVIQVLKAAIDERDARIEYAGLPVVMGDPPQLAQVIQNLISNAIKYTAPGTRPVIAISAERQDCMWRFAVRDNGIGFEPEQAERIFGPFKRLHGAEVPGAGIGLALCRRIVERHRGAIWAESNGKGATFYFTLPAAAPQVANANN